MLLELHNTLMHVCSLPGIARINTEAHIVSRDKEVYIVKYSIIIWLAVLDM